MKILSIDNMLEAAEDTDMPDLNDEIRLIEAAATHLANRLAAHLKIDFEPAAYERGFGGTCVCFKPWHKGQKCPEAIDQGDVGGEWEKQPYETWTYRGKKPKT